MISQTSRRPLRFPLRSHDQLYFLHIPKTAGTTLVNILKTHFPTKRTVAYGAPNPEIGAHMQDENIQERLRQASFIQAHEGYEFIRYLYHPVVITFLRDPYKRSISNFLYIQQENPSLLLEQANAMWPERNASQPLTFTEYLQIPHSRNKMVRMIGGFTLNEVRKYDGETMLEVAMSHLDTIPFFGLAEQFDESIELMNTVFNWSPTAYRTLNVNPESRTFEITPEIQQILEETNDLDMRLYSFAKMLFNERLEQMKPQPTQQANAVTGEDHHEV